MLWWFGRNEESLRLETRYDNETAEFVAIVRHPDGREQVERFTEADDFRSWLVAFERDLESQSWTGRAPLILSDGWPNKRRTGEE